MRLLKIKLTAMLFCAVLASYGQDMMIGRDDRVIEELEAHISRWGTWLGF